MKYIIPSVAASLAITSIVIAAPVPITNPSFESPDLSPGGWSDVTPTGWIDTQGDTNHNFVEEIAGFAAEGAQHLGFESIPFQGSFSLMYQDLPAAWAANTIYTLTVGIGNRANFGGGFPRISLGSSTSLDPGLFEATEAFDGNAVPLNTFADRQLQFTTGSVAPGGNVRIVLSNDPGGRVHFDNVRLDATPVPEPSTLAIAGLAGAAMLLRRRRR